MNLTNLNTIREIADRHGFSFSKGLGQNFLINASVCPRMAQLGASDGTIEIGTGIGVLTKELAIVSKKVVAVEIDRRLLPILEETLCGYDNVTVANDDFLNMDINKLVSENFAGMEVAVCANLPYYITTPIIMRILESGAEIKSITAMVQREMAERICAPVGTRGSGAVTCAVNYYGNAKRLFNVSRGSFYPAPNVDSTVIRIETDRKKFGFTSDEEKRFFALIKASFGQRRKTFVNAVSGTLEIDKAVIINALLKIGLDQNIRAERLSLDDFAQLTGILIK